jgi:hypothetical protein
MAIDMNPIIERDDFPQGRKDARSYRLICWHEFRRLQAEAGGTLQDRFIPEDSSVTHMNESSVSQYQGLGIRIRESLCFKDGKWMRLITVTFYRLNNLLALPPPGSFQETDARAIQLGEHMGRTAQ